MRFRFLLCLAACLLSAIRPVPADGSTVMMQCGWREVPGFTTSVTAGGGAPHEVDYPSEWEREFCEIAVPDPFEPPDPCPWWCGGSSPWDPISLDEDDDGRMDCWQNSVMTTNPHADTLDSNDTLGTNFGGPNTERPGHKGIDRQCYAGDPILAVHTGIVSDKGYREDDNGHFIRINHSGSAEQSVYLHMESESPKSIGDSVLVGQQVGTCGTSGNSTGHHLHLTIYSQPTPPHPASDVMNPESVLGECP